MRPIAGVILAAGESRRMGSPKALLPIGGETFARRAVRVAREAGLEPVRLVVGSALPDLAAAHPELVPLLVTNPHPEQGQLASLRVGLASLPPEVDAAVVHLVDHPLVTAETVRALLRARRATAAAIVVPVAGGRRGHPVLFGREIFAELETCPLDLGARAVVAGRPERVLEVEVNDGGIHVDVDSPADYATMSGDA
jgi:CTP:molybdopterin cytidylyltransferase MocA